MLTDRVALSKKLNAKSEHIVTIYTQRDPEQSPGALIIREAERRLQQGEKFGDWPAVGTAFRRLWIAFDPKSIRSEFVELTVAGKCSFRMPSPI